MLTKSCALACILALSACAYWPPAGKGGQAESFETAPAYWSELRQTNKDQLDCYDLLLQGMSASALRQRHPAQLNDLSISWTRALRAHAAHLDFEAQIDLATLRQKIERFQSTLTRENHFQLASTPTSFQEVCK